MFKTRFLVAAVMMAGLALAGCSKGGAGAAGSSAEDMHLGDPKAKVEFIEYASASCPHCARFNNDVFPTFKAKYIDTGKVHYTFKEFLTAPENVAAASFLLARCAGKDEKYFQVLDSVFKNQTEMFQSGDFRGGLLRIAQSAGMTEQQFTTCISDEAANKALSARVQKHATEDKISSTPTFVVNGEKIKEGEITMPELDAAMAKAGVK